MKNTYIILLLLLVPALSRAQRAGKWWGVAEAGIIAGSYGPSGDLRLQGGMKTNGWLMGLGAAYDGYKFESLPVYAQVRKMFGERRKKPFLMGSFGVNLDQVKSFTDPDIVFFDVRNGIMQPPSYQYDPGIYAELGAGIAFRTHRKFGWNLSFSYTRKTMKETVDQMIYNGSGYEPGTSINKYLMNRYAFRIGMQL